MTDNHILFTDIPFSPDISVLDDRIFFHGDASAPEIQDIWEKGLKLIKPKALFLPVEVIHTPDGKVASIGGEPMNSVILDKNLENCHRVFAYAATCGTEIMELHSQDDHISSALFIMRLSAVRTALQYGIDEICHRFDIRKSAVVNPGSLPQWPISEQPKLFSILGCVEESLGVTLKNNRYMEPSESVSGFLYETDAEYRNCMICKNIDCIGRQAPYDEDLAEKYKEN